MDAWATLVFAVQTTLKRTVHMSQLLTSPQYPQQQTRLSMVYAFRLFVTSYDVHNNARKET